MTLFRPIGLPREMLNGQSLASVIAGKRPPSKAAAIKPAPVDVAALAAKIRRQVATGRA